MNAKIFLAVAMVALALCACNGSESTTTNTTAPVTPLANSTVTPYQQLTANKRASVSPTPCVGKYIEPGVNGAPDELRPCPDLDANASPGNTNKPANTTRPVNVNKPGNVNKNAKRVSPPAATDSIEDN
jgi:hypothetical protein